MATVISNKQSTSGSPYAMYTLDMSYSSRTASSVYVSFTLTWNLKESSSFWGTGYTKTAHIYCGNNSQSVVIKTSSATYSGNSKHTATGGFTVSGLSTTTSALATALQVTSSSSSYNGGNLTKTAGSNLGITTYNAASTYTISPTSINLGGSTTATISMYQSTNKHLFQAIAYNSSGTSAWSTVASSATGASRTLTFPIATFAHNIPTTATSASTSIDGYTYNSAGTSLGYQRRTITLNMTQAQGAPSVGSITLNSYTTNGATFLSPTPVGQYKATIGSSKVTTGSGWYITQKNSSGVEIGSVTKSGNTITSVVPLNTVGDVTLTYYVKDSRGFVSPTKTITYIPRLSKFYIYDNNEWHKTVLWIYSNDRWQTCAGYLYDDQWYQ